MTLHLALVIAYAVTIAALGLWTARYIRTSGDFFVAGRGLGPGLVFSSMLAANIGAGATVGAAGLAYNEGLSAWWWSGSAGIGSLVLAFWVGPRLWRLANAHGFYTVGDFLEFRYGPAVRGVIATLIALISLVILAAQLIAGAAIVSVITGAPRWVGATRRRRRHDHLLRCRRAARHGVGQHAAARRHADRLRRGAAIRARRERAASRR